jgi:N-acetylmuramoyl-L-alanine amidase
LKVKVYLNIILLIINFLLVSAAYASSISGSEKQISIIIYNNKKYISIRDLVNLFDLHNSYDIITGRGQLLYKGAVAVYQTDFSVMLINGKIIKTDCQVEKLEGEIILPVQFMSQILDEFYPQSTHEQKGNIFYITINPEKKINISQPDGNNLSQRIKNQNSDRITFLIIDPGHGGKDPGAIGKRRIKEKTITLKTADFLADYLKTGLNKTRIISTRSSDRFIELAQRTEIANKMLERKQNGLFISIHVNASILPSVSGFETYFLSQNPSNDEARATAALENNVIILENNKKRKNYEDVEHVEAIMLTTQIQKESRNLANSIQSYLKKEIRDSDSKGVKNADFFVLRGSLMPAVLVEIGYISNSKEAKKLNTSDYQKKIAKGIGDGILKFIQEYNKNNN